MAIFKAYELGHDTGNVNEIKSCMADLKEHLESDGYVCMVSGNIFSSDCEAPFLHQALMLVRRDYKKFYITHVKNTDGEAAETKKIAETADQRKAEFVKKAYSDVLSEYSKLDDDLNMIGHPEECKRDWLVEAIESGILTESEFDYLFGLMETTGMEDAMAVA